jgi:hypothetical protein
LRRSLDPAGFARRDGCQDRCWVFLEWETGDGGGFGEDGWEDLGGNGALGPGCLRGVLFVVGGLVV